jgi:hypothetical protein
LAGIASRANMAAMLAQAVLALSLVVRVYDTSGVQAAELARARSAVDRILDDARLRVVWAECPCTAPVGPAELMIRISAAPPDSEPASLGFSYVDVDRKAGTLATVFADRVGVLARAAGADEGELLGRAMAHEIGHLLLGTRDHDRAGLMRGRWTTTELTGNRPLEWMLSRTDGATMRQAVVRRMREPARPAAVIAGLRPQTAAPRVQ